MSNIDTFKYEYQLPDNSVVIPHLAQCNILWQTLPEPVMGGGAIDSMNI